MFELHHRLKEDCLLIGKFPLSILLLMNDANYPWFILVPERENLSEIHDLGTEDQSRLISEIAWLSENVARSFGADKINVAALGNMVPQLHIHVIARFRTDPAWPGPVWGRIPALPYNDPEIDGMKERLKNLFTESFPFERMDNF